MIHFILINEETIVINSKVYLFQNKKNAPYRTEMYTFQFWIVRYVIWDMCIVESLNLVYSPTSKI